MIVDNVEYPHGGGHNCAELMRRNEMIVALVTIFVETGKTITVQNIVRAVPSGELKYEDVKFCPHCGVDIEY